MTTFSINTHEYWCNNLKLIISSKDNLRRKKQKCKKIFYIWLDIMRAFRRRRCNQDCANNKYLFFSSPFHAPLTSNTHSTIDFTLSCRNSKFRYTKTSSISSMILRNTFNSPDFVLFILFSSKNLLLEYITCFFLFMLLLFQDY